MFTPWGSFEPIQISALDPFGCLPALVLMGSWTQLLQLLEPQISIQALPEKEMLKDVSANGTHKFGGWRVVKRMCFSAFCYLPALFLEVLLPC